MPSSEEVIQGAGSVWAMTGLDQTEFSAFLPHFEHAYGSYRHDCTIDG